ncbi:uncharacterized protein LOC113559945 [Rhopalosiphum maidis]|uniref:uncharacterized protein LOC113559945 n=1 Tax=Rhopalosiphum maidis TaxID=43146 RepID=UPI000F0016B7|nr:uncharacterized protein LOC113559945 [Rhopalosiphum maidis]
MLMLDDQKRQNDLVEFLGQLNETQKDIKTAKVPNKLENKCVCSKRYFKKWENRLKLKYIAKLAIPKPVHLRPWPNPKLEAVLPLPVVKATLTGKIPSRIYKLAVPKIRTKMPRDVVHRTFSSGDANLQYRQSKNLLKTRKRILELARPKPKIRHVHDRCLKSEFPEKLYSKPNKLTIQSNSNDWIKHQKWLKKNAAPKKIFRRSPEVKRRSKLTKSQTNIMLNRLSQMPKLKRFIKKLVVRTTEPRPFGQITPMGLGWVQRLSVPRKLSSETQLNLDYDPGVIPRAALNAIITPRLKELAEPKFNIKTVNTEFKENAFKISPTALTYKATKRIKKLAMPRVH